MPIRWTVPAAEDLESIRNYLHQHSPHFAEPTVRTIYQRIRSLKTSPSRGRRSLYVACQALAEEGRPQSAMVCPTEQQAA